MTISAADKLRCAKRELAMRHYIYPQWVSKGRMKQSEAEREIVLMEAIVKDYQDDVEFEEGQGKLL